ncbi:MAG: DUF1439 domain-containing protein [Woeseiaceae bacterium]
MQKRLITFAIVAALCMFGAYLYFQGKMYTFRFTESELQEKLAERVPLRKSYLLIFEVVLDEPRLALVEGSDRVNVGFDVTLNIKIKGEQLPLGGALDVSGGVRYEAAAGRFFLTDPVIENLTVQGIPAQYTGKVNSILTKAVAYFYSDRPIYTLRASDAKKAAAKLLLKNVIIEQRVLVVTLGL